MKTFALGLIVCALTALPAAAAKKAPLPKPASPPAEPVVCADPPTTTVASTPPPSAVAAKVRVMLPDLETTGRYGDIAAALGQVLAAQAGLVPGLEILSAAEVRAVLDQEANKSLMGCDKTGCLAELADAMDAELVVSGRLEQSPDGAPLLSLTLINARAVVVVNRVNTVWRGDDDRLPDVMRTAAQLLLLEASARAPGAITVTGVPPEARVFVDGVDRTLDHASGSIGGVDVGVHEVSIEAADKLPLTIPVVVESGKDVVAQAVLEDVPVPSAWLWGGGIAAVVVGAAATGLGLYFAGPGAVSMTAVAPSVGINDVESLRGAK